MNRRLNAILVPLFSFALAGVAHAQIHMMPNAGHAPFWDDAAAFNRQLRVFCEGL